MCYVYRYIDINRKEVVYIGKVTKDPDIGYDPLLNRHKQHKNDEWYKNIGSDYLVMQYIELENQCDADILETYLISIYDGTGQLANKAKTGWGKSKLFISNRRNSLIEWRPFACSENKTYDAIMKELSVAVNGLLRRTENLEFNVEANISVLSDSVRELASEHKKAFLFNSFDKNDDFIRNLPEGEEDE